MPWSGSSPNKSFSRTTGSFTGATAWAQEDAAGTRVVATKFDTHDQDLATGINTCLAKDGGNSPTANINWGGFKVTNLGNATADQDALNRRSADARYSVLLATKAAVEAASIASGATQLMTAGHTAVGDFGGALYRDAGSEPSHDGKINSADGQWWENSEYIVTPQMFGAVADGSTDDAAALQSAINFCELNGCILFLPPGTYALESQLTVNDGITIAGCGARPVRDAGGRGYGSWLYFNHTGIGIKAVSSNSAGTFAGLTLKDFGTVRNQPSPTGGWTPTANSFDIQLVGVTDVVVDNLCLFNPTRGIQVIGNQTGSGSGNGRIYLTRILMQAMLIGIDMTHCYDVVYMDEIHIWPISTVNINVITYTRANASAVRLGRVDNPKFGKLFAFGYYYTLEFYNEATGGYAGLPTGNVSKLHVDVLGADNTECGMFVDAAINGIQVICDACYVQSDSALPATSAEDFVQIEGDNGIYYFGYLQGIETDQGILNVSGSGNTITVASSFSATIGGTEFNIATGNTLRLLSKPISGASPVYGGSGTIETPEYRTFSATVSAQSGTITTSSSTIKYSRSGRKVSVQGVVAITTNGTGAGSVNVTLPFTAATDAVFIGREKTATGAVLQGFLQTGTNTIQLYRADNTYPGGDGYNLVFSGEYDATA